VPAQLAQSGREAAEIAARVGFPVVMKIASADIAHKSDIDGVMLGIEDALGVASAFDILMSRARTARPDARLDGVVVARQIVGGVEMMLGASRDPTFGPIVAVAVGGRLVEVLGDVAIRVPPITDAQAITMIEQIAGARLLAGVRGQPPADIESLAACIARFSAYVANQADALGSIDINPLVVQSVGDGCVALDALIEPRHAEPQVPAPPIGVDA
jgi:acetate---CoA ligase (ADP-forming)